MLWTQALWSLLAASTVVDARRSLQHAGKDDRLLSRREPSGLHHSSRPQPVRRQNMTTMGPKFLTEKTKKFVVNGTGIPEVNFDVGESYAGRLPISRKANDTNLLYFWFFPSTNAAASKEVLIWLNGGPGCSSLEGLLQENGPFQWQYGTYKPVSNPWSWHRLTNVVWVEQPVGTGFSSGQVTARNEEDVAAQFLGFWQNFMTTFAMQGYKVYITGESYAGQYCPYIASAMLDKNDTTYYDMKGMLIYDPVINYDVVTEQIPAAAFVDANAELHPFNASFKASLHAKAKSCGYTDFLASQLVYPPKPWPAKLPGTGPDGVTVTQNCDVWGDVINGALDVNPCWDIYQVATTCPLLWDVLGFPGTIPYLPDGAQVYFDRADVKRAVNAPVDRTWEECSSNDVFVDGRDSSLPSGLTTLPKVIDRTKNVLISHGALDFVLLANGTLLAIQNMTWGGARGFQTAPAPGSFYVPFHDEPQLATLAASGTMGTSHTERGLTYVGVDLAGHMLPQYAPSAAFRQLEFLLGRVEGMGSDAGGFTVPIELPASVSVKQPASQQVMDARARVGARGGRLGAAPRARERSVRRSVHGGGL